VVTAQASLACASTAGTGAKVTFLAEKLMISGFLQEWLISKLPNLRKVEWIEKWAEQEF
jgi:hypothetical protein